MAKLTPREFAEKFWEHASKAGQATGLNPLAILAHAAIESGWGAKAPGFNFFGYKPGRTWQGRRQLLTTTEYHTTRDVKYPQVITITPQGGRFKYVVKDWFRAYDTPEQSFRDYANLITRLPRYAQAKAASQNLREYGLKLGQGGYFTANRETFANLIVSVGNLIAPHVKKKDLPQQPPEQA